VRWQGQRRWRDAAFEEDALVGEAVDKLGSDVSVSVSPEPIGADRVEGDHQQVEAAITSRQSLLSGARN